MIACPHPDCDDAELETFTVSTGDANRLHAECPRGHDFEVQVTVADVPF